MPAKKCAGKKHRYRRMTNLQGKMHWKCMDCPSFTYTETHLLGNPARCFYCESEFTISPESLRYARLKCSTTCRQELEEATTAMVKQAIGSESEQEEAPSLSDILRGIGPKED
jgi:hypothetical protein